MRICVNEKQSNLTIDIRRFNGYEATFEGIQLNFNQCLYLKTSIKHLDSSVRMSSSEEE